jgi:GntR family transcriptional regulator
VAWCRGGLTGTATSLHAASTNQVAEACSEVAIEYRLQRRSGVATYLQIVQQTKQALRLGLLQPGDQLPTAKDVVAATAINPNTVLKAYRELEREGFVDARPGLGTFVRLSATRLDTAANESLRDELTSWMKRAREVGLDPEDVEALFTAVREEQFQEEGVL